MQIGKAIATEIIIEAFVKKGVEFVHLLIVNGNGKHTVEQMHKFSTLQHKCFKNNFGIAGSAGCNVELFLYLLKIINLSVVANPNRQVIRLHGLMTGRGNVDNAQTAMDQPTVGITKNGKP